MVLKDSKVCPSKHRNVLDIEKLFRRRYFAFFLHKPPLFNLLVNRLASIHVCIDSKSFLDLFLPIYYYKFIIILSLFRNIAGRGKENATVKNVNDEFAGLHCKYQTIVIDHPEVTRYIKRPDLRSTRILSHTRGRDCLMLELWNSYWRLNLGPSAWVQSETYNTTRGTCRIPQLCGLEYHCPRTRRRFQAFITLNISNTGTNILSVLFYYTYLS